MLAPRTFSACFEPATLASVEFLVGIGLSGIYGLFSLFPVKKSISETVRFLLRDLFLLFPGNLFLNQCVFVAGTVLNSRDPSIEPKGGHVLPALL